MAENKETTFTLMVKESIEPIDSYQELCGDNVTEFLENLSKRLIVNVTTNNFDNIIISSKTPKAEDRNKIWIKTSFPYGIGFMVDEGYLMDYGLSQYPVRIPFMALPEDMIPLKLGVSELSESEITQYGIPAIKNTATKPMKWYIFKPEVIKI